MVPVRVLTLVLPSIPGPSILVLQPEEDMLNRVRNTRIVPIWIGPPEATQLGMAISGVRFPRPMTHDLVMDILSSVDTLVDHVFIYDVQNTTFFAQLCLRQGERSIIVDARPSDAISLALRDDAPLYMADDVFERASFAYCFGPNVEAEKEMEAFHSFVDHLSPEDFR